MIFMEFRIYTIAQGDQYNQQGCCLDLFSFCIGPFFQEIQAPKRRKTDGTRRKSADGVPNVFTEEVGR